MKRVRETRGFTLVELIIVLVVIGILAAFIVISYVGITEKARRNSLAFNAQTILRNIKVKKSTDDSFVPTDVNETNLAAQLGMGAENYSEVSVYYTTDDYVYIVGQNTFNNLTACGIQDNISIYDSDDASCPVGGSPYSVENVADSSPGAFGGGDGSTCNLAMTVDSIEDLVYLSNQVNAGNTYSGKCIKLMTDLDFLQSKSYVDSKRIDFGDINGNGIVEGLKKELTTVAGFKQIGDYSVSTHKFSGTFIGNLRYIYNLYINRSSSNYVGLFGYLDGTITAVNLAGVNVTGNDSTGGIVGRANSTSGLKGSITESYVEGNVNGHDNVGLVVGYFYNDGGNPKVTSNIVQGNASGNDYIGGIVGRAYAYYCMNSGYLSGINKSGAITASGSNAGRLAGNIGKTGSGASIISSGISMASITVKGSTSSETNPISANGATISSMTELDEINFADFALDTYIGGDNDSNGYYWDYDNDGHVVQRSTSSFPLTFNLSGSGTDGDPYLIGDADDLMQASMKPTSVLKLTANINMSGQRFYMLGSYQNRFSGKLRGNEKTISNITINSPKCPYLGLVGYNQGIIDAVTLDSPIIIGFNYTGALSGYAFNGNIYESAVIDGTVVGNNYTGLLAGQYYNDSGSTKFISNIVNGNVTGADYVGGLIGYAHNYSVDSQKGYLAGINKGGAIIATGTHVGRVLGGIGKESSGSPFRYSAIAKTSITINGSTVSDTYTTSINGSNFTDLSELNNINLVENALDTYIGGDQDGNGYYWDYDGSGNVVRRSTSSYPLTFNLAGSGTDGDPYQIADYEDLRQASMKPSYVYKLTANIDMTGEKHYMVGSFQNRFTGKFKGDDKTISNLTVYCPSCSYFGLVGYNHGTLDTISLTNLDITAGNYVGGVVGITDGGQIFENSVTGSNIIGGTYIGLVFGYYNNPNGASCRATSNIAEGNISGANYVGGIGGYVYSYSVDRPKVSGVNKGGSVIATGANVARSYGAFNISGAGCLCSSIALTSTTVNGSTVSEWFPTAINGAGYTNLSELNEISLVENGLDTYINGDDDGNGYYWDYDGSGNVVRRSISSYPLTFSLSGAGSSADPYLVTSASDLRQASMKLGSYIKLTADIDMTGSKFYMIGSYMNRFTGSIIGNAKTINNVTINCPHCGYTGLVGFSSNGSSIKGINLTNLNMTAGQYAGGLAGYMINSTIIDSTVSGTLSSGGSYVGLGAGYLNNDYGSPYLSSITIEGSVSGYNYVGGLLGYAYRYTMSTGYIRGVNKGGSITASAASPQLGRILGATSGSGTGFTFSSSAVSSITVNGSTVTSSDPASKNGLDITSGDLSNSATYTARAFNFTDEALDYIWYIDGSIAKFREGTL